MERFGLPVIAYLSPAAVTHSMSLPWRYRGALVPWDSGSCSSATSASVLLAYSVRALSRAAGLRWVHPGWTATLTLCGCMRASRLRTALAFRSWKAADRRSSATGSVGRWSINALVHEA